MYLKEIRMEDVGLICLGSTGTSGGLLCEP